MSLKNNDEEHVMHSKSDNIAVEVIEEHLQSLLFRYQVGLETSMKGSDFIFDCAHLLCHKCHKINFKRSDYI